MTNHGVFDRLFILFPWKEEYQLEEWSYWRNSRLPAPGSIPPRFPGVVQPLKAFDTFPGWIVGY